MVEIEPRLVMAWKEEFTCWSSIVQEKISGTHIQPMPAWPRWMWWLIAERPGKVRTLKQHPRKNKTAINIEYMKASIKVFRIIRKDTRVADNQLAIHAGQGDTSWERSH
jgi:hypothetical protein